MFSFTRSRETMDCNICVDICINTYLGGTFAERTAQRIRHFVSIYMYEAYNTNLVLCKQYTSN